MRIFVLCLSIVVMLSLGCNRSGHVDYLSSTSVRDIRLSDGDSRRLPQTFRALDRSEQRQFIAQIERQVSSIPFNEQSYHSRSESLERYCGLVAKCFKCLEPVALEKDLLWQMRLNMLDRINLEIDKCNREPVGGPYGERSGGEGGRMFQREYLQELERLRFESFRNSFEDNRLFCNYYRSLSNTDRLTWTARLEKNARRKVVVWDPGNPSIELPRYTPTDNREWVPSKDGERREYIEHVGQGKTIRMREVKRKDKKAVKLVD